MRVGAEVRQYEEVVRRAAGEAAQGRFKEAYNLLGGGPWGTDGDQELRHKRGLYAYNVAHQRLNEFQSSPSPKNTLIKAGCWLARSEAYLLSAAEGADDRTRSQVAADVERTRQEQDRFRTLVSAFGEVLFVASSDASGDG